MTVFSLFHTYSEPAPRSVVEPWIVALDLLPADATYLRLIATRGEWTPLAGLGTCGPNGLLTSALTDDRLIVTDCPAGALIGRIGGSSASLKSPTPDTAAGESKPFPVGSHVLLKVPAGALGPLYLGFNMMFRPFSLVSLEVEIHVGKPG